MVLAVSFSSLRAASGAQPTARLHVDAPVGSCIDFDAVRAAVIAKLARDPFSDEGHDLMQLTVAASATGLHARLERQTSTGRSGVREIDLASGDCRGTLDTLAFMIAMALDPIALSTGQPTPPPRQVARVARFGAGVAGSIGTAPGPTVGGGLAVGLDQGRFGIGLEGRVDLGASVPVGSGSVGGGARLVAVTACWHSGVELCAIGGGGWFHGEGRGFPIDRTERSPLLVGGLRVAWPLAVGPVQLVPSVDALGSFIRTHLDIDGRTVWASPPAQVVIGLGTRWRL
jgi:hypothetical protein